MLCNYIADRFPCISTIILSHNNMIIVGDFLQYVNRDIGIDNYFLELWHNLLYNTIYLKMLLKKSFIEEWRMK